MSVPVANPRILLLGGHGKVSLLMTPRLLSRGWSVTSLIRDPAQESDIKNAGSSATGSDIGKLDVLVDSLEDVATHFDAKRVLDKVNPDWIVWSAGQFASFSDVDALTQNRRRWERRSLSHKCH